ncbi:helix-turn-helix domain-containing protein [Mycobacterium sp. 21AC1]|uniref:helix-turn-helix domain-containing protein n=1 Tax=[Mycobacterium] appelbergii TaxID=2939269 RepID=UPI002939387C|nr:helix-turn-helix domain-containing protein [Mycobacterium sp. 21AC1]MDV3130151.1 helix-turn-helix domain-containing protein [Mycobacterium sp. 21AC1]
MTGASSGGRPGSELLTWLGALRELSAVSTSATDLRHVLNLVADTARTLLGFDFVGVLTPDAPEANLLITGWSGLSAEYVARVNTDRPIGLDSGSPSSRAFRGGQPVALRDITHEPEFGPWGGVAGEQGYRAIVCVPLVAGDDVLGTLNGYYTPVHTFTGFEIERLTLLANHAAIALTSASRLDQLRQLNESLRAQRDVLTRSEQIHDRLLAVTLRSGGLSGIAAVLTELIARPVLIDDTRHVVLATAGDAGELPDAQWRARAVVEPSEGSAPVLVNPHDDDADDDGAARFFVAVARLGDDVAARIWFPHRDSALDPVGVRAVEHASIVISLELLRMRTAAEVEHRLRGELLADLLGSGPVLSEQLLQRAQRLGHNLTRPHTAIVGALTDGAEPVDNRVYQRALSLVSELVTPHRPRPLAAMHRGNIVTMWPAEDGHEAQSRDSAAALVQRAMAAASTAATATVTVSPRSALSYGEAYRTAKGALDIAVRSGRTNTVVQLEDLGVLGLLLQLDDAAQLAAFADRALGPLLAYDDAHHTDLVGTLRTYFACKLDRAATAAALHVHPNTVTQRLRRIETLCDVDLTDPSVAVHFSAALTVQDVASVGE